MTVELMSAVGYRTRSKLLDALSERHGDLRDFHDRFRLFADLVQNPIRTATAIRDQLVRAVGVQPSGG